MKCKIYCFLALLIFSLSGCSIFHQGPDDSQKLTESSHSKENCAILAGDSWSMLDAFYHSSEQALGCKVGHDIKAAYLPQGIGFPSVIPGSRSDQWATPLGAIALKHLIDQNPNAKVLILYMGGNDYAKYYNAKHSGLEGFSCHPDPNYRGNGAVNRQIAGNITRIINIVRLYAKAKNRDLKIVLMGYSKVNVIHGEAIRPAPENEDRDLFKTNRHLFENVGCPTQREFNLAYKGLNDKLKAWAAQPLQANVAYIDNFNLFEDDINKATPPVEMLNVRVSALGYVFKWIYIDAIHLSGPAQRDVADRMAAEVQRRNWLN